jgi:acetyl esterase/lipase
MNVLLIGILLLAAPARPAYPPQMDGARVETYKTCGDTKLNLYIFRPAAASNAPAIVFFFGGGWTSGTLQQFEPQCRAVAARGMVAVSADYRVASRHQAKPVQCLADARSAIRWVRAHAAELGVDPQRIAAAGGSAGGHLAACTAFITAFPDLARLAAGVAAQALIDGLSTTTLVCFAICLVFYRTSPPGVGSFSIPRRFLNRFGLGNDL